MPSSANRRWMESTKSRLYNFQSAAIDVEMFWPEPASAGLLSKLYDLLAGTQVPRTSPDADKIKWSIEQMEAILNDLNSKDALAGQHHDTDRRGAQQARVREQERLIKTWITFISSWTSQSHCILQDKGHETLQQKQRESLEHQMALDTAFQRYWNPQSAAPAPETTVPTTPTAQPPNTPIMKTTAKNLQHPLTPPDTVSPASPRQPTYQAGTQTQEDYLVPGLGLDLWLQHYRGRRAQEHDAHNESRSPFQSS